MKKLSALLIAFMLIFASINISLADENEKKLALQDLAKKYLDEMEYKYDFYPENNYFHLKFNMENTLGVCDVWFFVWEDMICFIASPNIKVPESRKNEIAILCALFNNELFYAHFNYDMENGTVEAMNSRVLVDNAPSNAEMDEMRWDVINTLEKYGESFARVALGTDPYEEYNRTFGED